MLIKALCEYNDLLERRGENTVPTYASEQRVSYMIFLRSDGEITGIADIREQLEITQKNGKSKTVLAPRVIVLPKRSQKPGIDLNIIEHRPLYIFGLNYDKGTFTPEDKTNKAKKSHQCFAEGNLEFCRGLNSDIVKAYCNFIEKWEPEKQTENPFLLSLGKDYDDKSYYCFALDGHPEIVLHRDKELIEKYAAENVNSEPDTDEVVAMCAIEGEPLPIARIHEKIKGIRGGNPTGGILVGINDAAFESYGKTQSYNSCISVKAMKKYTSALNRLLESKNHHTYIDDMTLVFFALSSDDENECECFNAYMNGTADEKMNDSLKSIAEEMKHGRAANLSNLGVDENVTFYIAGLTPNSSRISQKFILRNKFGRIMDNILMHQEDMAVEETSERTVTVYQIMRELVSPKAKAKDSKGSKVPPTLLSDIMYAILNGTKYPEQLLSTVVCRIKTDSDEEKKHFIKINDTRIGIIKACLNRKARLKNKEEEITMSLNLDNQNPAYLCGRLFAVLEKIQQDASGGGLNRTIKDAYFSSVCSRPASILPKLIQLSQNHLKKLGESANVFYNRLLGEIIDKLGDSFPKFLNTDEQGRFIIGYSKQNKALYTSNKNKNEEGEEC